MKTFCQRLSIALIGWLLIFGVAAIPAFAADDAAPDPTDTPVGLVFRWINFLVVAGGLAYVLVKVGGPYFRGEAQSISQSIREAAEAKAAAEREVAQADQRLAHLQSEIGQMREVAKVEASAETERIRVATRSETEKIEKAAQAEIAASERAGQQEMRAIAGRLATERAAALMGQKMTPETQAALFQSFVEKLTRERIVSTSLANHYAEALADVAVAKNMADQVRQELADFVALQRESPELRILLGSPAVSRANKLAAVQALVTRLGAGQTLRNFLFVVLDHRRMALIPEIQIAFDAQLDKRRGVTRAEVTSAEQLSDAEKAELRKALEQISGRQVEAEYLQDPALIAGAVVRIGSKIYDGSVRSQLQRLRTRLTSH